MASKGEGDGEADPGRVREQLARILASSEFQAPERGRRFLEYVVEEALEGRCEQLKAYTIAQAVFGRDATFDAQNDPVVRIEAGRIRRALERYYLISGGNDPVRITIPKGGYAPSFESRGQDSGARGAAPVNCKAPALQRREGRPMTYRGLLLQIGVAAIFGIVAVLALIRPLEDYFTPSATSPAPAASALKEEVKIVVEPLATLGGPRGAEIAKGLVDQLITQLMKVDGIVVLAPSRSIEGSAGSLANLQGSVAVDGMILHLHVRLVKSSDGTVVWAREYDRDLRGQTILDVEDDIAAQIAEEISKTGDIRGALPAL